MVRFGVWLGVLGLGCCSFAAGEDPEETPWRFELGRCEMKRLRPQIALQVARPRPSSLLADGLARLPGCARERVIAWSVAPELDRLRESFEREIHVRHAREAGPDLLHLVDGLSDAVPGNRDLLLAGVRLNGLYAFALLDEEDPEQARRVYAKARAYGTALLESPRLLGTPLPHEAGDLRRRLERTDRRDVPALCWAAFAWGLDTNVRRDSPEALADQPFVQAILTRVVELDERYYHALPHILLGYSYGVNSARAGGDPARARRHFERALRLSGRRYLLAHLIYAKTYAVQSQDRALFRRLLEEVIHAPRDLDPSQALANVVARERATRLLARADELILPEAGEDGK